MNSKNHAEINAASKERSELLYGIHRSVHASIVDFAFKHGTILVAFTAWILTAKQAQDALKDGTIAVCVSALILTMTAFHATWARRIYLRSSGVCRQLAELNYMPREYFEHEKVDKGFVVSLCVLHLIASVGAVVIIWLLRRGA
jgi:hypothetical protein